MNHFKHIGRKYKDDLPSNTTKKIKSILNEFNIKLNKNIWSNLFNNLYSVRIESDGTNICFGANGKGRSKLLAEASAYAEFIERLQNNSLLLGPYFWPFILLKIKKKSGFFFYPDEKIISEKEFLNLPSNIIYELLSIKNKKDVSKTVSIYFKKILNNGLPGVISVPFYCINKKEKFFLPLKLIFNATGSTGMAAGNSLEEAIFQGLCEIMERYAASVIYYNCITPPTIPDSYLKQFPEEYKIIQNFINNGYDVKIKDFSCNLKLPVLGTLIIDKKNKKYKLNVGSDTSFQIALSRTLTEIIQGIGTTDELKNNLLNIPTKKEKYFYKKDTLSIKKVNLEFEKFTINGTGVFPISLFKKKESYNFDKSIFGTKKNYKEEVKYIIDLFKSLNSDIYIRDVSFLGFSSVFIYASNGISCSSKKNITTNVENLDLAEKQGSTNFFNILFPLKKLITKRDLEMFFSSLYYSNTLKYYDNLMADVLALKFNKNNYWSILPISFFISLQYFKNKDYEKAYRFWTYFINKTKVEKITYYQQIQNYMYNLFNNHNKINIPPRIIKEMNRSNLFDNIELPNCPKCELCKLSNVCITNKNATFSIKLIKRMKKSKINQESLKLIFQ